MAKGTDTLSERFELRLSAQQLEQLRELAGGNREISAYVRTKLFGPEEVGGPRGQSEETESQTVARPEPEDSDYERRVRDLARTMPRSAAERTAKKEAHES